MVTQGGAGQGNGSDVSQCNVGLGLAKACWRNMRPTCPGSLIGATNTPSFNVPGRGHYLTWAHSFLLYQPKTIADPDWPITPSPPWPVALGVWAGLSPPGRQSPNLQCHLKKLSVCNLHSCKSQLLCVHAPHVLFDPVMPGFGCLPNTSSTTFRSRSARLVASPAAREMVTLYFFFNIQFHLLRIIEKCPVRALKSYVTFLEATT